MQTPQKDTLLNFTTNLTGLTSQEAQRRLTQYGYNKITEEKSPSWLKILIRQFLSPMMYILMAAAIASFFIREMKDVIVITIALLINVTLGFIQERKAERSLSSLKTYEKTYAQVRRDGTIKLLESTVLVPGDIVLLTAGSKVPADIRLSYVANFTTEEAILTGESQPVTKQTENMAYSGTYVLNGKAEGMVVATGLNTELGKITQLITQTPDVVTPLQKQIRGLSWLLSVFMIGITGIVFITGFIKHIPLQKLISTTIALAVAAVPEGLMIAITVILAIGMQRMLKKHALVRHLIAAETLGSVSVICTDKTGTLTLGHMTVDQIITTNKQALLQAAVLNNDAQDTIGDPVEIALLKAARQENIEDIRKQFPRIAEIPFSSDEKYMVTVHNTPTNQLLIIKGAPEKIFDLCAGDMTQGIEQAEQLSRAGLRVIALASKSQPHITLPDDINHLTYLGLIGLQDPIRPEVAHTIAELTAAGIKTVIITGDHQETALKTAKQAGLTIHEKNVLTGIDTTTDLTTIELFARVEPKDKIKIVTAWQEKNQSVAMIGDGVNDAPALKAADIGVALGSGSDVAHEISDMVLLDNNFASISAAVYEGRVMLDNIRKIIAYLVTHNLSTTCFILFGLILNMPLPLLAIQILWTNLITDGFPYMGLTVSSGDRELMKEPPRGKNEPLITPHMKKLILFVSSITTIGLLAIYAWLLNQHIEFKHIQTIIFTILAIDPLVFIFSVKDMKKSLFRKNPFSNKWLNLAVGAGMLEQLAAIYFPPLQNLFSTIPLNLHEWGLILAFSLTKFVATEVLKEWWCITRK
jgi:ATPase, P-type (transporting), HAD superfamily, subfamily IC/ATPase, P-type (transporting), HAD superfamily, subfamily IC